MKTFGKIFLVISLLSLSLEARAFSVTLNPQGESQPPDFLKTEAPITIELPPQVVVGLKSANANPEPIFFRNTSRSFEDYLKPNEAAADFRTLGDFIKISVQPKFKNRVPQNAKWTESEGRVTEFQPDISGLAFDPVAALRTIVQEVRAGKTSITLNPVVLPASLKLADISSRGITSLVARGSSDFSGSTASRIKNITVGISRFQGLIVPAGQTFSFNDTLGPVDGEHGFAPELVIKHNGVFPEFGGGLCQVSTTVFRAALNGGLPVTERRNHSFAVHYYFPQGTDATIYPGVQDLKFVNDTPGDIMIWAGISGTSLAFDFYGQPDDRQVEINQPVKYDVKSTGAFKTSLTRVVKYASGTEKKDTFVSSYRPEEEFTQTNTAVEPAKPAPPSDEGNNEA